MTTLFPQIKRVDEDETSKIIKNVLFDDQDEMKLEQILDEFMHLTQESITYSDEDDSDSEEPDEDDDEVEEENGDSDGDSDESDISENDEDVSKNDNKPETQLKSPASREPTSWNLEQFIETIPVTKTQNAKIKSSEPIASPSLPNSAQSSAASPVKMEVEPERKAEPKHEPKHDPELEPDPEPGPDPELESEPELETESKPEREHESRPETQQELEPEHELDLELELESQQNTDKEPKLEPQPQSTSPEPIRSTEPVNSPVPPSNNKRSSSSQIQSSGRYLVQIDLSKLKRVPTTKAPTPTAPCSNSIMTAKALKHEADAEKDKTKQAIKYLESAMYFVLHGYELETSTQRVGYYTDTIPLFKHSLRLSMPGPENQDNMTNLKIHTLGLRCLSLVCMRLYKAREREIHENNKIINSQQNISPIEHADGLIGVRPQLLSAYKRQLGLLNNLRYANDYWLQADQFCDQHPAVRIFLSTIESNCGTLTMTSQFSKLMDQVKCGLKLLRTS